MTITQKLLTVNKYSRPGMLLNRVTALVIHYTADAGATAQNERDYFNSMPGRPEKDRRYVSSHYIVGLSGEIIQCVPETEIAYCSNQANDYSISIETCHPDATGKFNTVTETALAELAADICTRHGLDPRSDMIRHYDVTGKHCPKWYVDHPADWTAFRQRVAGLMVKSQPDKWAVRVGHFSQRETAQETAGKIATLGFYNEVRTDTSNGKYVVDVFSFGDRNRADALAWLLNNQKYSVVNRI